jgi:CRP/FNR family transcriptional regulator, cyclic AMP receptor protein
MVDANFLSKISIFSSLGDADLEKITTLWKPVTLEEGQLLFQKGDPGDAMYIIRDGWVAITIWNEDHQETILSVLKEGNFFGELALLDGSVRSAAAKALGKSELLEMKRNDFMEFLRSRPEVAITMMSVIAARLRATNEMMEKTSTKNVNEEMQQHLSLSDKVAKSISKVIGSWEFLFVFILLWFGWIYLNVARLLGYAMDPYPFNFLNFMLASVTAIQAPIILMTQNRQSETETIRSELDYETNVKAELQIQNLHVKINELRASEIREFTQSQKEIGGQLAELRIQLDELQKRLGRI